MINKNDKMMLLCSKEIPKKKILEYGGCAGKIVANGE